MVPQALYLRAHCFVQPLRRIGWHAEVNLRNSWWMRDRWCNHWGWKCRALREMDTITLPKISLTLRVSYCNIPRSTDWARTHKIFQTKNIFGLNFGKLTWISLFSFIIKFIITIPTSEESYSDDSAGGDLSHRFKKNYKNFSGQNH